MLEGALGAYQATAEGALAARLRFLAGLTAIQADITETERPYTPATTEVIREALLTGQPVFLSAPPAIPRDEFLAAVRRIAEYVADEAGLAEEQAAALRSADFEAALTDDRMARAVTGGDAFLAEVAGDLGAAADAVLQPATVAYVLASALGAFLVGPARTTREALGEEFDTAVGRCPMCGSPAAMGLVHESTSVQGGERQLWCGLCHTTWGYNRVQCVRCGTQAPNKLRYVHVAGDEAHRLHVCDECHGSIRTVFAADLDKPLSFVVEDVVTAELDAVARTKGYTMMGDDSPAE